MTVLAAKRWNTNAELIADAQLLGYVGGLTYDMTPGDANALWWRECTGLTKLMLNDDKLDFTDLPFPDDTFDTVAYDPPYKLNGTKGLAELNERYGVNVPAKVKDRHALMVAGLTEAVRVARSKGHILVKCQDQVSNGRMHWQTDLMTETAKNCTKVDEFLFLGHSIPQPMGPSARCPNGRKQRHAHGRPSSLLIFKKD
jgi:tRNA G10  N-methylase Trm11